MTKLLALGWYAILLMPGFIQGMQIPSPTASTGYVALFFSFLVMHFFIGATIKFGHPPFTGKSCFLLGDGELFYCFDA